MYIPIIKQREQAISFGLRCYYCEILLDPNTENLRNSKTEDHIIPRCKSGNNRKYNKVYCCSDCNQFKANLELHEFYEKVLSFIDNDKHRYDLMLFNIRRLQSYKRANKKRMIKKDETISRSFKNNN